MKSKHWKSHMCRMFSQNPAWDRRFLCLKKNLDEVAKILNTKNCPEMKPPRRK